MRQINDVVYNASRLFSPREGKVASAPRSDQLIVANRRSSRFAVVVNSSMGKRGPKPSPWHPGKLDKDRCHYPMCGLTRAEAGRLFRTYAKRDEWAAQLNDAFPDVNFWSKCVQLCSRHFDPSDIKYVPFPSLVPNARIVIPDEDRQNYNYTNYVNYIKETEPDKKQRGSYKEQLIVKKRSCKRYKEKLEELKEKVKQLKAENAKLKAENRRLKGEPTATTTQLTTVNSCH